jgi:Spy/CpxP family protein refolding chaperone
MKTTRCKTAILVVLCVLLVGGLLLAGPGGPVGRGGRQGAAFGPGPGNRRGPETGPPRPLMWAGRRPMLGERRGVERGMMLARVLRSLDLTDEQKEQVKGILEAAKDKTQAAREALADATKRLHTAVTEGADEAAIREAAANLGKAIGDQAVLRASTMASIKEVLTDEQREQLEKMKERVEKFGEKMKQPGFRGRLGGARMRGDVLQRGRRPGGLGAGPGGPSRGPGEPGMGLGGPARELGMGLGGPARGPGMGFNELGIGPRGPGIGRGGPERGPGMGFGEPDIGPGVPGRGPGVPGRGIGVGPGGGLGIDRLIERVDTNGDGTLTAEELEAFKEKIREQASRW